MISETESGPSLHLGDLIRSLAAESVGFELSVSQLLGGT